jgi:DNA-binding transcriptional activator of the SARP family
MEVTSQLHPPYFRVWLCGPFRMEQWRDQQVDTAYEALRTAEWGGSNYPRLLLKALLCCPGRQARRESLLEMLWPETDPEQASVYLNTATTKLRKVLQSATGQQSLLLTENDSQLYILAGQDMLWVDADAALALLKEAECMGHSSSEVLPLLEEAVTFFNHGTFLDGEEGLWVAGRRATIEQARYRCRVWLAEVYEQQRMPGQAETTLSLLLEEDPFDEDILCRLMSLLHQQGMTHQALRLYEHATKVFAKESMELSDETKGLITQIRGKRHAMQHTIVNPMHSLTNALLTETVDGSDGIYGFLAQPKSLIFPVRPIREHKSLLEQSGSTGISMPPLSLHWTDNDVLAHLSSVLSNVSVVEEKEIAYFDQQTRLYWRAREEITLPTAALYARVIKHIDDITMLLTRLQQPILRTYLCEIICRTVLLAGILLYDMGQYEKAQQHYQIAFQAAHEANNTVLQSIVWGWMSFAWTYTKHYPEALRCVQQAQAFARQTTDRLTQAWLSAIEAEIQAHLHNRHVCTQALNKMELYMGASPSQDTSYLFEFNSVLLLGYKGVCLQQLYQPQNPATHGFLSEAKEALEQALANEVPLKRKLYYLSDLAGVYARQGEIEKACSLMTESIPLIMHIGSGSQTIRTHLLQARSLLQPNEHTPWVKTVDEQLVPLFFEKHTQEF